MEVRINGQLVDTQNAVIAVTRQAYDFTDLGSRFVGRTNEFILPKTTRNSEILSAPEKISSNARNFEVFYNAEVIDQGVTVLTGFAWKNGTASSG